MPTYSKKLRALLSPDESAVFKKLSNPNTIQDYLDSFPINFSTVGDVLSPRRVLEENTAQCLEGALFAAASLAYHGQTPLLLDFQTIAQDEDHVVALFKRNGFWGAISKTNHAILRFRDPVYASIRELSMSYFHEYYMRDGRKSMRAFSTRPFDLRRYEPSAWVTAKRSLDQLAQDLDDAPHTPAFAKSEFKVLRRASKLEQKLLDSIEWPDSRKKKIG
jgi:hypothetical protein